jgi:glycogen debranching enzyme
LSIERGKLVRLSAEISDPAFNQIDLMVSELEHAEFLDDPQNFLHVRRRQMLDDGLIEEIVFTNFLPRPLDLDLDLTFGADFADIFEVRGARRERRGILRRPQVGRDWVELRYDGVCGTRFATRVEFAVAPKELTNDRAQFLLRLGAGQTERLEVRVRPSSKSVGKGAHAGATTFGARADRLAREAQDRREESTCWTCDNPRLQRVLDQSMADLGALTLSVEGAGEILGAGIPWFCAPFGRDALLTSYSLLAVNPAFAQGALRTLAHFQGKAHDPTRDEEPGKIFHELRFGEMARAREVPHSPYYGSADATPLFVVLAEAAYRFHGDRSALERLAPAIIAALRWIDVQSKEGTAFVAYERKTPMGIENQCWKDSRAGVSFADGSRPVMPIAVCEVQGYAIDAYARGARLLAALGRDEEAAAYARRADTFRELFEKRFFLGDKGRYAFAIDGRDRILDTIVSNTGHLLWSRVVPPERAPDVARLLLSPEMCSGFGVRTLAEGQPVYNPLSYHNGTVWPHDNAIIAAGLSAYDLRTESLRVFDGIYEAMSYFPDARLPELFCGLSRESGPLVRYPVACSPQAWASAAPFLLLQSILGIEADAPRGRLVIRNPHLPSYMRWVEVKRMKIGQARVSMRFRRVGKRCHVERLEVTGGALKTEIEIE